MPPANLGQLRDQIRAARRVVWSEEFRAYNLSQLRRFVREDPARLTKLFDMLDEHVDGDARVGKKELRRALKQIGFEVPAQATNEMFVAFETETYAQALTHTHTHTPTHTTHLHYCMHDR